MVASPQQEVTGPPLLRYVIENHAQCCPEADFATLNAHCNREFFVLLIDDWEMLGDDAARQRVPAVELRTDDGGSVRSVTPVPLGDEPGTFRVAFGKLPEGRYQARVAGTADAGTRDPGLPPALPRQPTRERPSSR